MESRGSREFWRGTFGRLRKSIPNSRLLKRRTRFVDRYENERKIGNRQGPPYPPGHWWFLGVE